MPTINAGQAGAMATLQSVVEHLAAIEATANALAAALTISPSDEHDSVKRSADVARTLRDFVAPQLRTQRDQLIRLIAANSVAG